MRHLLNCTHLHLCVHYFHLWFVPIKCAKVHRMIETTAYTHCVHGSISIYGERGTERETDREKKKRQQQRQYIHVNCVSDVMLLYECANSAFFCIV